MANANRPEDLARQNGELHPLVEAMSRMDREGLYASWLGRRWDDAVVNDLLRLQETRGIHPCGEGGKFETLVLDAPPFAKRLEVTKARPEWRGTSGVWRVETARLGAKS